LILEAIRLLPLEERKRTYVVFLGGGVFREFFFILFSSLQSTTSLVYKKEKFLLDLYLIALSFLVRFGGKWGPQG